MREGVEWGWGEVVIVEGRVGETLISCHGARSQSERVLTLAARSTTEQPSCSSAVPAVRIANPTPTVLHPSFHPFSFIPDLSLGPVWHHETRPVFISLFLLPRERGCQLSPSSQLRTYRFFFFFNFGVSLRNNQITNRTSPERGL